MSPVERAGSFTGTNFALGWYEKFQPGFRDEKKLKILRKFDEQSKHDKTQKL